MRLQSVWDQFLHLVNLVQWAMMLADLSHGLNLLFITLNLSFTPIDGRDYHLNKVCLTYTSWKGSKSIKSLTY